MKALLITQCLQNDFVKLLEPQDPLPNALHVGYQEALRLLGEIPSEGPLSQAMEWAYSQSPESLGIIHIRDWHQEDDPDQADHLAQFGVHCLAGTPGADFVFSQNGRRDGVTVVDASGLNDFHQTSLAKVIEKEVGQNGVRIPVGLMGVWTEAKVYLLAYELTTRYPQFDLAVCSALCASSSRTMHFTFLRQLKEILGVRVYGSLADFTSFLNGSVPQVVTPSSSRTDASKLQFDTALNMKSEDQGILLHLFRDCESVKLKVLDGGFSGNLVLRGKGVDLHGHQHVPVVLKLGKRDKIAQERMSFEEIQEVLGNNAPAIVDFVEVGDRGGIKYRYAAMKEGEVRCFQDLVEDLLVSAGSLPLPQNPEFLQEKYFRIKDILDQVFVSQLGRLYEAASLEKLPLLKYYEFSPRWADSLDGLAGTIAGGLNVDLVPGLPVKLLGDFYRNSGQLFSEPFQESHYTSYIHGDLNGKNILVDPQGNVWIIDFFNAHRGHVLRDFVKLENDLLYIYLKLRDEKDYQEAQNLVDQVLNTPDLGRTPDPELFVNSTDPRINLVWKLICHLRSRFAGLVQADRSSYQLYVAQLRYAAHTLSFDECSPLQKRLALYACLRLVQVIQKDIEARRRLRIDWLPSGVAGDYQGRGQVGLTIFPGRKDWGRNLESDLDELHRFGVQGILCLVTPDEFKRYGVPKLLEIYRNGGFQVLHLPIRDGGIPTEEQLLQGADWLDGLVSQGKCVAIHCVGGLGRSGLMAASWLTLRRGVTPQEAIDLVRKVRSPRAIETSVQEKFIQSLKGTIHMNGNILGEKKNEK